MYQSANVLASQCIAPDDPWLKGNEATRKKKARSGFTMRAYGQACRRLSGEKKPTIPVSNCARLAPPELCYERNDSERFAPLTGSALSYIEPRKPRNDKK